MKRTRLAFYRLLRFLFWWVVLPSLPLLVSCVSVVWPSTCELKDGVRVCQCKPTRVTLDRTRGTVTWTCVTPQGEEPFPFRAEGPIGEP